MRLAATALLVVALSSIGDARGATTYQSRVNALCRSYTPRMQAAKMRMEKARAAGDLHTYAYNLGVLLGMSRAEGVKIEATPVPAALAARMARPLRLLHRGDSMLRIALDRAVAGDAAGFQAEATALAKLGPSMNTALDTVGLRDCGSGQS